MLSLFDAINTAFSDMKANVNANSGTKSIVFALMGPNGAGKTRHLRDTAQRLQADGVPHFLVPAARQGARISSGNLAVGHQAARNVQSLQQNILQILSDPKNNNLVSLQQATSALIWAPLVANEVALTAYTKALLEWDERSGPIAEKPVRPKTSLHEIEDTVARILNHNVVIERSGLGRGISDLGITFENNGIKFNIDGLSDGEQQILLLTLLLLRAGPFSGVVLVDEPELFLNEARAVEIWEAIERNFPSVLFVYSTHSIQFATRETVDRCFLVGRTEGLSELDLAQQIPSSVIRDIVGTRIQILRSNDPIVFCEDAMHKLLLPDILTTKCQVIGLNGRDSVQSAVPSEGAWAQIQSEGIPLCGVIDLDAHDCDQVAHFQKKGIYALPYYDGECILLSPEIAPWFIKISSGQEISASTYDQWVIESAEQYYTKCVYGTASFLERRMTSKILFDLDPVVKTVKNVRLAPNPDLVGKLESRIRSMSDAIKNSDVDATLRLFRGKDLYKGVSQRCRKATGYSFPTPEQKYRELRQIPEFVSKLRSIPSVDAFARQVDARLTRQV
jgi:hypothetical protein